MFAESISIATLLLCRVAGIANRMDGSSFAELAAGKLSSGDVPIHAMHRISEKVDEFVGKILAATDLPVEARLSAMGAFSPAPPDYVVPLLELVSRLARHAATTSRLPRQMDAIIFERLVRRRNYTHVIADRLALDDACERLVRLIATFLKGQLNNPPVVDRALMAGLRSGTGANDAELQGDALFQV